MNLGDHLEPMAKAAGDVTPALAAADVAIISIAMSAKRIADLLEPQNVCEMAPTEEELAARPSRRIAAALETVAKRLDHLTDYFDAEKAQLRVGANCDVRPVS